MPDAAGTRNARGRRVVVVSGPSGAGKGTLIRGVVKYFPDLAVAISATTRRARPGERDGREYYFLSAEDFQQRVDQGRFLEHVDFAGNRYGTLVDEVERLRGEGLHVILELELEGALAIRSRTDLEPVLVFIQPPDFDELERRLRARASDSDEEIRARMALARRQVDARQQFDHVITNDEQDRAVAELQQVIAGVIGPAVRPAPGATRA